LIPPLGALLLLKEKDKLLTAGDSRPQRLNDDIDAVFVILWA